MKVFLLEKTQYIPTDLDTAWDFFSSPINLKELTPDYLNFKILSNLPPNSMYPGMMIEYKVHPILGIPLGWLTEITHVDHKKFFVDEQRIGPYAIWHHEHHFEQTSNNEIKMTDKVHYALPTLLGGRFSKWLFVGRQLESIFQYRYKRVEEIFGNGNTKMN